MIANQEQPILFFDGVCNLCNGAVQFVIRHDKKKQFLFAALQSESGAAVIEKLKQQYGIVPDSVVLQYKGKLYSKSDAILRTALLLGGRQQLWGGLLIVPRFLRNAVYDLVARYRYQWFGKKDSCMIPTPELQARFLP